MSKKINPEVALTTLRTEIMLAKFKLKRYFDSFAEDEVNGTEIEYNDFKAIVFETEAFFLEKFKSLFGEIPDIPEPVVEDPTVEPEEPVVPETCDSDVFMKFTMTHQYGVDRGMYDCGFMFDSVRLVITTTNKGTFTYNHTKQLLIKDRPRSLGQIRFNIADMPCGAIISNAHLLMVLNKAEGIANADNSGIVEIADGNSGKLIRYITAADDIKGKGYDKYHPNVPIDLTDYIKGIRGADFESPEVIVHPFDPIDDSSFTLTWMGSESDHSDRDWWTKIGGEEWYKKWTLPDYVENSSLTLRFEFDNGVIFTVSNPAVMQMNAGGPKYLPAKTNDPNPKKRHPKISEPSYRSGCKSVKVTVIK